MSFKVKYVNLKKSYLNDKSEIDKAVQRVLEDGSFILRDDVKNFENNISSFLDVKYTVGVNSGTDALFLSCKVAGIEKGDEVITVGHTFVATLSAIHHCGAKPIIVDIKDDFNMDDKKIEDKITNKTKAIIPVHLNGRSCDMDAIVSIAKKYNLIIIEDACQSIGSKFDNKYVGTFGHLGCFSLHPMKSLHCAGDGGYITTNNKEFYKKLLSLRNHGQSEDKKEIYEFGYNSRLDNMQAAIANIRLKSLDNNNLKRRTIALKYSKELSDLPIILPPTQVEGKYYDVYNSYVIRLKQRDELYKFLIENGIEVFIHMAKPLSEYKNLNIEASELTNNKIICNEILSLPIYPELEDDEVEYVILKIKEFFKKNN